MSTTREATGEPRHKHDWKRADDWEWGPGTVTYECFGCRGLRVVRPDTTATIEGDPETLAAITHLRQGEPT